MSEESERAGSQVFPCRWMSVRRVGRAQLLSRLSVGTLIAPVVLIYGLGILFDPLGVTMGGLDSAISLFVWGTAASVVLALASVTVGVERRGAPGTITAGADGFVIDAGGHGERVARERIAGALVLQSSEGPCVEIHLDDGRVLRAGMRSRKRAHEMVDKLGMGPDRRRLVVPQGRPSHALVAGCATYPAAFLLFATATFSLERVLGAMAPFVLALLVTATTLIARRLAGGAEIVIGAEGVSVRFAKLLTWFTRFEELRRVVRSGRTLTLELHPGADGLPRSPIRVACADADLAEALADRIDERLARARGGPRPVPMADLLDPGDRPVAAWREELARLLHGRAHYRSAAVVAEDLLDVVEDPSAPPKLRIGAAIALRGGAADEARARVRIAADTCADERVRAALEAAAADEEIADGVIARALTTKAS